MAAKRKPSRHQTLARQKALEYIRILGVKRAAQRLAATVKQFRKWLKKGFPADKVKAAIELGRPGGPQVAVQGTNLKNFLKKHGREGAARLTGLSKKELRDLLKRRPNSRVRFTRDRLKKEVEKRGIEKVASLIDTKPSAVEGANRTPYTQSTLRLRRFVTQYGLEQSASFFGVSTDQLSSWTKDGIDPKWKIYIDRIVGKKSDEGPEEALVRKKRTPKSILGDIERAKKLAQAWNKKVPSRYRISLAEAERWGRLGIYREQIRAAQDAYQQSKKKPAPPPKKKPEPPKVPQVPLAPPLALPPSWEPPQPPKPPTPATPPKPKKPTPDEEKRYSRDQKRNFLQARSEAFSEGRYPKPKVPWGRVAKWKLVNRYGIHVFKRVEKFVHDIDLQALGTEIIKIAQKIWALLQANGSLMTVRFTFSVMGEGNPFYENAFVEGDRINFIPRSIKIISADQIEYEVRTVMRDIYQADAETTMLFLEYYEVIKSLPIART